MKKTTTVFLAAVAGWMSLASLGYVTASARAQEASVETTSAVDDPAPLTEDELEILVARIALYPDELIAVISGASLLSAAGRRGSALSRPVREGQEPEAQGQLGRQRYLAAQLSARSSR